MAPARLTQRATIIAVAITTVALGTLFVAQPESASASHEPAACQTGNVLTPGYEEKDAIENAGDEKCYLLSGLEAGKSYVVEVEKAYVKHIHAVYWNGGGIVTGEHSAIADSVLSVHDYTHYRCSSFNCPPENKLLSANHAPPGDPSAQIEFTPSGGEELYAMVSGYAGATGGFKIRLSQGVYRMAEQDCGPLGSCLVSILDIDPCALGGCASILSGTIDMYSSGDAAQSESAAATDNGAVTENAAASDGTAAIDTAGLDDSGASDNAAAASDGPAVVVSAAATDNEATTDSPAAGGSAAPTASADAAEDTVATESAAAVDSAVASDNPDQPSNTHRLDSTSQPDSGSLPEQPSLPSAGTVEVSASGGGQGGMFLVGLVIAGLAVVLAGGLAGVFAVWKMRWSGR